MQAYLHSETMRVVPTYLLLGTVALLWALMVLMTKFSRRGQGGCLAGGCGAGEQVSLFSGILCWRCWRSFFMSARRWDVEYFILYVRSATGIGDKAAGYMLTATLAAFAVGGLVRRG